MHNNDLKAIADLYRVAKATVGDEVYEECVRLGTLATKKRKDGNISTGQTSFGLRRLQVAREQSRQVALAHLQACQIECIDAVDVALSSSKTIGESVEDALASVKSISRHVRRQEHDEENKAAQTI